MAERRAFKDLVPGMSIWTVMNYPEHASHMKIYKYIIDEIDATHPKVTIFSCHLDNPTIERGAVIGIIKNHIEGTSSSGSLMINYFTSYEEAIEYVKLKLTKNA